jgi:hypothetical protein
MLANLLLNWRKESPVSPFTATYALARKSKLELTMMSKRDRMNLQRVCGAPNVPAATEYSRIGSRSSDILTRWGTVDL